MKTHRSGFQNARTDTMWGSLCFKHAQQIAQVGPVDPICWSKILEVTSPVAILQMAILIWVPPGIHLGSSGHPSSRDPTAAISHSKCPGKTLGCCSLLPGARKLLMRSPPSLFLFCRNRFRAFMEPAWQPSAKFGVPPRTAGGQIYTLPKGHRGHSVIVSQI